MRTSLGVLVCFVLCTSVLGSAQEPMPDATSDADPSASQYSYQYQDRGDVQEVVDGVMARPEFLRLRGRDDEDAVSPAWLERFFDWLAEFFAGDDARDTPERGTGGFVYGVAFLIVAGVLAFIIKAVFDASRERELTATQEQAKLIRGGAAPGETSPEHYWIRAQELAAAGNEKLALQQLLLGAMSALERQGLIRHRRGLTNRDYFWAARGEARQSIHTIVTTFEHVFFGRREATAAGFRECARAYRQSFYTTREVGTAPEAQADSSA
jgi:hypothetical protein